MTAPEYRTEFAEAIKNKYVDADWLRESTCTHLAEAAAHAIEPLLREIEQRAAAAAKPLYQAPTFDFQPGAGGTARQSLDRFLGDIIDGFNLDVTNNPDINRTSIDAGDLFGAVHDAIKAAGYVDKRDDAGELSVLNTRISTLYERIAARVDEDGLLDQHIVLIPLSRLVKAPLSEASS